MNLHAVETGPFGDFTRMPKRSNDARHFGKLERTRGDSLAFAVLRVRRAARVEGGRRHRQCAIGLKIRMRNGAHVP